MRQKVLPLQQQEHENSKLMARFSSASKQESGFGVVKREK